MSVKATIRVSEFQKLYYSETGPFRQKHWEALCRYLEKSSGRDGKRIDYFRILNRGVQFTNFVGVIQAGDLAIEVLPKIDRGAVTAANKPVEELNAEEMEETGKWQGVLLQMLRECRLLRINHVDHAQLNLRRNSILDIYIRLFLAETESLVRQGLLKRYHQQEGNRSALKGSLLFSKQIAKNSTHAERFYVRHTEYSRDNLYNQLLYKTLKLIPKLSPEHSINSAVHRLLLDFPELADCKADASAFDRLSFDRKTERYKEALLIAKMLLLNYRPDITGGKENVIAILFDMNRLWEEWIYQRLKKEEGTWGITVLRQQWKHFWRSPLLSRPKTVRPDMVITKGAEKIIVDTKWKVVEDLIPSDSDLKQMYVYNLFWNTARSVLLYPAQQSEQNHGKYSQFDNQSFEQGTCMILTVNILNGEGRLREDFSASLLRTLSFRCASEERK